MERGKSEVKSLELQIKKFEELVSGAKTILVLQPEKPDSDSLGSSIALENILGDLGKEVAMYCQDEIPGYIRTISGWDRVSDTFPTSFDFTILVDTGGPQMVARTLEKHGKALGSKPFVIIDHHTNREPMPFETIDIINTEISSAGHLIYNIASQFGWAINLEAKQAISVSIIADTGNFVWPITTPEALEIVASFMREGLNLPAIHAANREASALDWDLFEFKQQLLSRIEFYDERKIAILVIKPEELKKYADRYDPAALVVGDMRSIKGVKVTAVLRQYDSTDAKNSIKIKGSLRSTLNIAADAASHFGGGGHLQAAGFRVDGKPAGVVKAELVEVLTELIKKNEAI